MATVKARVAVLVGLAPLLWLGCSPSLVMADPAARIEPTKLAALPPIVEELELDDRSQLTRKPDWEAEATRTVNASIACRLGMNGGVALSRKPIDPSDPTYSEFRQWASRSLREIDLILTGKMPARHKAVTEFQFDLPLDPVKQALRADFALISFFRDGAHTMAREVSNALGPIYAMLIRDSLACAVDLSSGRIIWCQRQSISGGITLRTRPEAQLVVDELLRYFGKVSTRHWVSGRPPLPLDLAGDCGALQPVGNGGG